MTRVLWVLLAATSFAGQEERVRFGAVDVFVDSGNRPLAAYQIELVADGAGSKIVGVEGGAAPFDAKPPYYDPAALKGGRIVLAAFTTGGKPPAGRIRVARVHFQEAGPAVYSTKLITAASPGAGRIDVTIEVVRTGEKK